MKIILSRKGVDSSSGGFASPIINGDTLLPIAIPDSRSPIRYRDLQSDPALGPLIKHLSHDRLNGWSRVHLDPDLTERQLKRQHKFVPVFGQCGAAQTHLASHDVGAGDLFLFFGWFRQAEYVRRRWKYVTNAPDIHVIFGWMQVEQVLSVDNILSDSKHIALTHHPHCFGKFTGHNTLYVGRRTLSVNESQHGAGFFTRHNKTRTLTAAGCTRSLWQMPAWMHPQGRGSVLSYHNDLSRWNKRADTLLLRSVARGQEFVLDTDDYPEALDWVASLFSDTG